MSSIQHLLKPHERDLGGFTVKRLLPSLPKQAVGPFIFFDHMGPAAQAPGQGMDVRPHPHIGLATVTYLYEGEILHRDSLGSVQRIRPGDVNWMTAGSGVVHSERSPDDARARGQTLHGLQTWFALPKQDEDAAPGFWHHPAETLPLLEEPGLSLRVVLGSAYGARSPVHTYGDTLYVAGELAPGAAFEVPAEHAERGVYVARGRVEIDGEPVEAGQLAVLTPGVAVTVAATADTRLLVLGGEPLDGPRFIWWNFVASSRERIEEAKLRWQEGRFPQVPGETEFIPLPQR
ncbi:pirin family protein [Chitinimonas koreensis]|uniref:pirin family protein n=1 Tax=Chitinimonas koreensis TaxID=356302 RepID=UPI0003FC588F|nr:pirin family protein [Chitinimonas koreensis]QNM98222.1 pirin family protein [Chitinimonas koreensis]